MKEHKYSHFNFQDYISLVENTSNPMLQSFMEKEKKLIEHIENKKEKTVIDLGAGYGRALPFFKGYCNVLAIENNREMFSELKKRTNNMEKIKAIFWDITQLFEIIENEEVSFPIVMSLQNSLWTVDGNVKKVFSQMKKVREVYGGSVLVSFFRAKYLNTLGFELYESTMTMTGKIDYEKSLQTGILWTESGYSSKWWSDEEIHTIIHDFWFNNKLEIWEEWFYIGYLYN